MANEVRLIDANALQNLLLPIAMGLEKEYGRLGGAVAGVMEHVDAAPTIDPESLRPKGRWTENRRVGFSDAIEDDVYWFTYTCSECGGEVVNDYHYCPNCGAKMMEG